MPIHIEGLLIKDDCTGQVGMLDIDIKNYDSYLDPNGNDPSLKPYEHDEIPCLWKDNLYLLKGFYCAGMNTRFRHGIGMFKDALHLDIESKDKYFNEDDMIFMESLKTKTKYKL